MENTNWAEDAGLSEDMSKVSIEDFDRFMQDYSAKREDYETAKKVSGEKYAVYQDAENKLMSILKATGKKSYKVDGLGLISLVTKEVVTTPKTVEDKRKLFSWIKDRYGLDVLDTMVSINHQSLNSFYNQEAEKSNSPMFHIPGLEQPTATESLSFRRERG
jgi:hypothetical protein